MLSVVQLKGALARVDYLFAPELAEAERKGFWIGSACGAAGVQANATVQPGDLRLALEGFAPGDMSLLQQRRYTNRLAGWDFTFSASKSVSLAAESPALDPIITRASTNALAGVVTMLESLITPTADLRYRDDLAAVARLLTAAFLHRSNRWEEPHLHFHLILANTCIADGRPGWTGIRERHAIAASAILDRVWQRQLFLNLQAEGLPVALDPDEHAIVPDIPEDACRALSSGRREIQEYEAREGRSLRDRRRTQSGQGRRLANYVVRPPKKAAVTDRLKSLPAALADKLRSAWHKIVPPTSRRRRSANDPIRLPPPQPKTVLAALGREKKTTAETLALAIRRPGRLHLARVTWAFHREGHDLAASLAAVRGAASRIDRTSVMLDAFCPSTRPPVHLLDDVAQLLTTPIYAHETETRSIGRE